MTTLQPKTDGTTTTQRADQSQKVGRLRIGSTDFRVEIANTNISRQQGLMWRESMAADAGMLFVFDQVYRHGFWMKNTLIPLDMVWLDTALNVVDIQAAQPCPLTNRSCPSYTPPVAAKYVLEVNEGAFPGKVGDTVEFLNFEGIKKERN